MHLYHQTLTTEWSSTSGHAETHPLDGWMPRMPISKFLVSFSMPWKVSLDSWRMQLLHSYFYYIIETQKQKDTLVNVNKIDKLVTFTRTVYLWRNSLGSHFLKVILRRSRYIKRNYNTQKNQLVSIVLKYLYINKLHLNKDNVYTLLY